MEIWQHIQSLQGQTLRTLAQRKLFDVTLVNNNIVIVTPHKSHKMRNIKRETIESTYNDLVRHGEITRGEIEERFSPRNPAYVAALISRIPGVSYEDKPVIRLFLK